MTVYFAKGKAFLEVAENYLLCIGDEVFIRSLDHHQLWVLAQAHMLAVKYGDMQMPVVLPTSKLIH